MGELVVATILLFLGLLFFPERAMHSHRHWTDPNGVRRCEFGKPRGFCRKMRRVAP